MDSFAEWVRNEAEPRLAPRLPPLHNEVRGEGRIEIRIDGRLDPGTVLGDYELVRRLGVGGMGVVFEARQRHVLGRRVALKVLRSTFETDELARRFRREVAAIAELDHPAIVPVVDARVDSGTPYYVMKYIEGVSAAGLIRELANAPRIPEATAPVRRFLERHVGRESGADPPSRAGSASAESAESAWEDAYPRWIARLGLQLAEALQYAHERGFVHRDVKPANVLLTPRGRAVLVDFGLVTGSGEEALTRTGEFLGTLEYAAPEQVRGEPADARTDVRALGATLFELLALTRPFGDASQSELAQRIERDEAPPLGKNVPLDLRTIVGKALGRTPSRRYASAGAMAADLRAFLAGHPIRARPPGWAQRFAGVLRRHPRLAALVLGGAVVLGGLEGLAWRRAGVRLEQGRTRFEQALRERGELERLLAGHAAALARRPRDHERLLAERAEIRTARERVAAGLRESQALFEQGFEHVAGYGPCRTELARLAAERLRQALRDDADVLAPSILPELEAELARYDDDGHYASLRDPLGWMSLTSAPTGARVTLEGEAEPRIRTTPLGFLTLPEGSYVAVVEAPGYAPARLPFLVRRAAAYEAEAARPGRTLAVELLPADEVPEGFVLVPAGESLIDDDPPRWERIESFLMQRYEVSWSELLGWAQACEDAGRPLAFAPDMPLVRAASGRWQLAPEVHPDWPAKGATPMDIFAWTSAQDGRFPSAPRDWIPTLPTRAEWVRAARGADGRPYPWGWTFDGKKCANYVWGPSYGRDADPVATGVVPADRSPFGIHDLAGSVAEITRDLHEPRPGEYTACGGSYWCDEPADFRVTTAREDENDRPRKDVGLRIVLRPLPAAMLPRTGPPQPFRDDFDRPDSGDVGPGWLEFASNPHGLHTNPHSAESCTLENGRLVCLGGAGAFSEASTAWHPIQVPSTGCTVRARISATRASNTALGASRGFGLRLATGFRMQQLQLLSLQLSFQGTAKLSLQEGTSVRSADQVDALDPTGWIDFEIHLGPERVEGRIRAADGTDAPPLVLSGALSAPHFVGLHVPNQVGARVQMEWLEVTLP